jgi:hypothetical protein
VRRISQYDASVESAMHRRRLGALVAAALTLAVVPTVVRRAPAQARTVTVEGKVTWIAGKMMVVAPPGGLPVTIDLSQADLSDYASLLAGDWVVVTGTAPLGENRVMATSVKRIER